MVPLLAFDHQMQKLPFSSVIFFILCNDNESFLNQIKAMQYKVYFIWQPVATIWMCWLRRSCKALSKAKLSLTHKGIMVTVLLSDTSLFCYLFESGQIHYIWKVCHKSMKCNLKPTMPAAGIVHRKGLIFPMTTPGPHIAQPLSNVERIRSGSNVLPHLPFLPDLSPTDYHFMQLNNFCRKNSSTAVGHIENAFMVYQIPEYRFMLQE